MSIARRDLILGGLCVAGAGTAYALTPRQHMTLLKRGSLDAAIPRYFGAWTSRDVSNLVAPKEEDSLAARLYDETIERIFQTTSGGGPEVMVLMAHGDTQSNELQLHRPEVCYPAFGYEITSSAPMDLRVAPGVTVPARRLTAEAPGRLETIVYWSRLGEFMPVTGGQQRIDRLRTAMKGYIADGLLARFSVVGLSPSAAVPVLEGFVSGLLQSVAPDRRRGLIGTSRANAMTTVTA
jgi:EpsI family protein